MDSQKVHMFIMSNAKFFESSYLCSIKDQLLQVSNEKYSMWDVISTTQFKNPSTMLIVSIIAGSWGIDRFMIGDTWLGIGKLLTCGGLGVWTIIDWFMIQRATREKNMQKMKKLLFYIEMDSIL